MLANRSIARLFGITVVSAAASLAWAQQAPVKKDVPYVPTPQPVVDKMLELADVKADDVVYDLGCGDGRMVVTAAQKYGAKGLGIDIDPQRIKESNENAAKAGVTDKVKFMTQDLFDTDFHDATVMTMYLLPSVNMRLRPTILNLKPGSRIVSHAFDMEDWKPDQQVTVEPGGQTVYYWVVPAKVAGTWNGTIRANGQAPQQATLHLKQAFQTVSGTADIGGKQHEIRDGKLHGTQLTFALPTGPDGKPVQYSCKVDGEKLDGVARRPGAAGDSANGNGGGGNGEASGEATLAATRIEGSNPNANKDAPNKP
jgi:SAM-dependent methyltransferase